MRSIHCLSVLFAFLRLCIENEQTACREAHRYLYKTDLLTKLQRCTEIENFEKRGRSLLVVVATPPTDNYEKFTQKVNEFNSKEPFNFTMPSLFTQQKNYTKVCVHIRRLYLEKTMGNCSKCFNLQTAIFHLKQCSNSIDL